MAAKIAAKYFMLRKILLKAKESTKIIFAKRNQQKMELAAGIKIFKLIKTKYASDFLSERLTKTICFSLTVSCSTTISVDH